MDFHPIWCESASPLTFQSTQCIYSMSSSKGRIQGLEETISQNITITQACNVNFRNTCTGNEGLSKYFRMFVFLFCKRQWSLSQQCSQNCSTPGAAGPWFIIRRGVLGATSQGGQREVRESWEKDNGNDPGASRASEMAAANCTVFEPKGSVLQRKTTSFLLSSSQPSAWLTAGTW